MKNLNVDEFLFFRIFLGVCLNNLLLMIGVKDR